MFGRTLKHLSLTEKRKIRQEGERKRVEGNESPERKTDWEKERGGTSDFAAVFFLPSLLVPRGVPLWLTQSCRKKNVRQYGTSGTPSPTITGSYGGIPRAHTVRPYIILPDI